MTLDYSIDMQDSQGKTTRLFICGTSIDEIIDSGISEFEAREKVESNAFANAIYRGDIGADAWII